MIPPLCPITLRPRGRAVLGAVAGPWLAAVFPARCAGCGRPAEPVCEACRARLTPARPAPPPPGIACWAAVFAYEGVARELVARAKYHGRHAALGWLGDLMAEAWRGVGVPVDVVTWAPTSTARRRARGVDHARLLARVVAHGLDAPLIGLLGRAPGLPQTGQPAAARRRGPTVYARAAVEGTVLVVDDVATTGATLGACAAALHGAGAAAVVAVTAARTPRRTRR